MYHENGCMGVLDKTFQMTFPNSKQFNYYWGLGLIKSVHIATKNVSDLDTVRELLMLHANQF
ncbi:hypothetical protein BV242_14015 [Lactiplantibacillus plantarum]|nr:hypothetical protein BV233_14050 [Lactiplantibacillus plantarum]TAR30126.1 hypothetical protein BV234_14035 [Lactiplantibacillus plantarum]TAR36273.1 hypothetical protein BV220_14115 [Lactiplantibacillus plantarum]TAR41066.1 hypothetical protein BV222_14045 [Lactiplantibacillus plantarum]TAR41198.1 hypothetical protein BV235_14090 [Lactiplantibacillus plantarum]